MNALVTNQMALLLETLSASGNTEMSSSSTINTIPGCCQLPRRTDTGIAFPGAAVQMAHRNMPLQTILKCESAATFSASVRAQAFMNGPNVPVRTKSKKGITRAITKRVTGFVSRGMFH